VWGAEVGKIEEAQNILRALGLPAAQHNEMSALTLLALAQIGPDDPWSSATRTRLGITKGIMAFTLTAYGREYAPNTRETFRRQVLHQFVQAHVAEYNLFEPGLATNSPRAHYAISDDALATIQTYGSPAWDGAAAQFVAKHGSLSETYARHRSRGTLVPVMLPTGQHLELSPGRHNQVQKAVIEEFAPRFAPGSTVLYIGDTARKTIVMETRGLAELGFTASDHEKLPDIVLYDESRNWLYLIEAVTSDVPMSPKRVFELQEQLQGSSVKPIFVTAFPDMREFRKHMSTIAWETEVWLADSPDHLIHFNGDRFLGPR
jgi:hypothetical protein